jgi:agmatine deiminase
MIPDSSTNFLYLANTLPRKYKKFYERFTKILAECNIDFELLPHTRDVWAVDYMPIQVSDNHFVQFVYNPDYLKTKKYLKTISDVDAICKEVDLTPEKSDIVLDGGNVIKRTDTVIMCDKIFKENPLIKKEQLIRKLQNLFEVDQLFFVPKDPNDFTGHADGMVRFLDEKTVLINKYFNEEPEFETAFYKSLRNARLEYIEIPYSPDLNSDISAKGIYLNYLQMKDIIFIPTFGIKEDDIAVKQFEQIFRGNTIRTVDSNEIAVDGGVLNCISWNVRKNGIDYFL